MLVVHFITRRPEESKSPEAAVSEGQDLHLRQEGQESLVAQVAVLSGGPLLQRAVFIIRLLLVHVPVKLHLVGDGPRPSAPDAQEAQHEGLDDAAPLFL